MFPRVLVRALLCLGLHLSVILVPMGYSQDEHAHGAAPEAIEPADVRAIRTTHGLKTAMALRIDEVPIVVDARLDEPVWQEARVNLGFLQRDPQEGEPSTAN